MVTLCIIPARYGSKRLPGKPLLLIGQKPMIQWVYERAVEAKCFDEVLVATDDERILEAVHLFGGKALLTSKEAPSGTDRVYEAMERLIERGYKISENSIIINIQGDEPLIKPEMIRELVELMREGEDFIGTLAKVIEREEDFLNPNIVKVVFDSKMRALYFSRAPIPFSRERHLSGKGENEYIFKHIGIYGYTLRVLREFVKLPQSRLEKIESLEQLRALENGIPVRVLITEHDSFGVDTFEDLEVVRRCLSIYS